MEVSYLNKSIETLPKEDLEKLQLTRLKKSINKALKIEFYKKRLNNIGITSGEDIKFLSDIKKMPFTTKEDLRKGYPDGFIAINPEKIIRIHTSEKWIIGF